MKFNLDIRGEHKSKRIMLPLMSFLPRSFGALEAVIDTGAPKTIISVLDAMRLNIPFSSLETSTSLTGLGKGQTPTRLIKNFPFSIKDIDGKLQKFSMSTLVADVPKIHKQGNERLNKAASIPTLIGMDFLEKSDLKLFVDINNNISYLEK